MECHMAKRIRNQVSGDIAHRREIVDALEETRHVDGEDAGHDLCDGEEDGGYIYSEAGVSE